MNQHHNPSSISFASDNYSGIHPTILTAIASANEGHEAAYGADKYSSHLELLIKQHFGEHATGYLVFNGTGANVIALQAILPRVGAVLCTKTAHIYNDESNAPEYIAGARMIAIDSHDGKLNLALIHAHIHASEHSPQLRAVYISQVTELGTCYTLDEICAISAVCKTYGLYLYMDGARLSNAVAYLQCQLHDFAKAGVDILSFGGTKNGLMIGELLVVLNPKLDAQMKHLRKTNLHLGSKLRFLSAQFIAWLEDGLYLQLAHHSNAMAQRLATKLSALPDVIITQRVESNAVFAILPSHILQPLQDEFHFYTWNTTTGEIRLMTSFDTQQEDVDQFVEKLRKLLFA